MQTEKFCYFFICSFKSQENNQMATRSKYYTDLL